MLRCRNLLLDSLQPLSRCPELRQVHVGTAPVRGQGLFVTFCVESNVKVLLRAPAGNRPQSHYNKIQQNLHVFTGYISQNSFSFQNFLFFYLYYVIIIQQTIFSLFSFTALNSSERLGVSNALEFLNYETVRKERSNL